MSLGHSPSIVTSGLILCLDAANVKSYPGSGTSWTDLSKNVNNTTLINGPTYNSSNGGSLVFNGTSQYGQTPSLITPSTGPFSVSMWYKLSGQGRGGLFERSFTLFNGMSFGQGGNSDWAFNVASTAGFTNGLSLVVTYPTIGIWYYDVGIYNGTNNLLFYRNGIQIGSLTGNTQGNLDSAGTRTNMLIFYRGDSFLPGNVSNINIYNRALSATEVAQNFNALRGRYGL